MIELSEDTTTLVDFLFVNPSVNEKMKEKLRKDCLENIPFCENSNPKEMERIRFAILKLTSEQMNSTDWFELARCDWRDLFMVAGFGHDIHAHEKWKEEVLTSRSSR